MFSGAFGLLRLLTYLGREGPKSISVIVSVLIPHMGRCYAPAAVTEAAFRGIARLILLSFTDPASSSYCDVPICLPAPKLTAVKKLSCAIESICTSSATTEPFDQRSNFLLDREDDNLAAAFSALP